MNSIIIEQYPPLSFRFIKAYVITMRPYLMFVSGITTIIGMSFAIEVEPIKALLIFLAGFLSYGFGQALTDCFQIDTDSISSPYRPLTQGIVNRNYFLIISCLGLFFCISIFTFFNPLNIFLGILAGVGLVTYTYFKRKWWAGPFYNAWIVLVLFLMSYLAATESFNFNQINSTFVVSVIVVFLGYSNFVLTGYFKDINADKVTAYCTLPVRFGRKFSAVISDIFGFISALTVLILIITLAFDSFPFQTLIKSLVFIYTGIGMSVLTQISLHNVRSDTEAHIAISPCVHSYILLLSGLTVLNKPDWFILLIIFYVLYFRHFENKTSKKSDIGNAMSILLNKTSGGGTALKKWDRIYKQLNLNGSTETFITGTNGSTDKFIFDSIQKGKTDFIIAGGDGSINFFLNRCMCLLDETTLKQIRIGAIGIGSSNDFHKPIQQKIRAGKIPFRLNFEEAISRDVGCLLFEKDGELDQKIFSYKCKPWNNC